MTPVDEMPTLIGCPVCDKDILPGELCSDCCVSFVVPGKPVAQPRPRAFNVAGKTRIVSGGTEATCFRLAVSQAYQQAASGREPWEGPVACYITVYTLAPKSKWQGARVVTKPECDNYAKLVMDALNGVAYRDDRQIDALTVRKRYGLREETRVMLSFERQPDKPRKR